MFFDEVKKTKIERERERVLKFSVINMLIYIDFEHSPAAGMLPANNVRAFHARRRSFDWAGSTAGTEHDRMRHRACGPDSFDRPQLRSDSDALHVHHVRRDAQQASGSAPTRTPKRTPTVS